MTMRLTCAFAVMAALFAGTAADRARAACTGYDIVVLAGQSNAVGRGLTGAWSLTPAQIAAEPRVFQTVRSFDGNSEPIWTYLTSSTFQIAQAREPLMNDSNFAAVANRIGFAYSFALLLASQQADTTRCVLIVPAARSGTSVLEWNLISRQFAGDLAFFYLDMISRVKLALSLLPNSRVAAFLWLQGEMDFPHHLVDRHAEPAARGVADAQCRHVRVATADRDGADAHRSRLRAGDARQSVAFLHQRFLDRPQHRSQCRDGEKPDRSSHPDGRQQ